MLLWPSVGPLVLCAVGTRGLMLVATLAVAYTPDDGTQGYTPYFYKMDVPVRVRSSISYGRAWQMLRSRGAGSNATGPCDPPQSASSCNCSTTVVWPRNPGVSDDDDTAAMPHCVPSPLCGRDDATSLQRDSPPSGVGLVLVLDMTKANLRFPLGGNLARGYGKMVREIIRCALSLQAVQTQLPLYLLASGTRYAAVEELLSSRYHLRVLSAQLELGGDVKVPSWASKWARGSFAKLRALSLTRFERLVVLDADSVVLRNIDHLARMPAPAFVFAWKCYPRRELRASTMVLQPSDADYTRALALVDSTATGVYDDLGEQSVWRRLYTRAHELPAGYATMRTADLSAESWRRVHIVHDAHLIHDVSRGGWHEAGMTARVTAVDKEARRQFEQHFAVHFEEPRPKGKGRGGKGRGRRGRARGRRLSRASIDDQSAEEEDDGEVVAEPTDDAPIVSVATGDGPTQLTVLSLCALFSATASSLTGFGGAVIFLAFAAVAASVVDIPLLHVVMLSMLRSAFTNPVTVYLGGRKDVDWQLLSIFYPCELVGIPIGQLCLYLLPARVMQQLLSAVCLVVVLERLFKLRREGRGRRPRAVKSTGGVEAVVAHDEADEAPMMDPSATDGAAPASDGAVPDGHAWRTRRTCAAVVCALASGVLGASLGTSGIPILLFGAYFPLSKGKMRTLVCAAGMPAQYFALSTFAYTGVLDPRRDWPAMVCVISFATAGVAIGDRLHQRVSTQTVSMLLLLCLTGAAVELLSSDARVRLAAALALSASAALILRCPVLYRVRP